MKTSKQNGRLKIDVRKSEKEKRKEEVKNKKSPTNKDMVQLLLEVLENQEEIIKRLK